MLASISSVKSDHKERGFALVLALALLSLVFLLVISLVNLVSTDLSLVEARKEKILAQAHARMGMRIAIGEIQKHLGPDMRISGTADLLDERIESARNFIDQAYEEDQSSQLGVDLNEDGNIDNLPFGQRFWTGVWKHRGRDRGVNQDKLGAKPLPENLDTGDKYPTIENSKPMVSSEFDPHPAVEMAWLVSGNEGFQQNLYFGSSPILLQEFVEVPDGNIWDTDQPDNGRFFIRGGVYGSSKNAWKDYSSALLSSNLSPVIREFNNELNLPGYNHPLYDLPDPEVSDEVEWILKAPLLKDDYNPDQPENWKNFLSGEPVKVRKTRIEHEVKEDKKSKHGAYAYWVGDEGVKTKASLFDPNKGTSNAEKKKDNLSVACEPNLSFSFEEGGGPAEFKSGFGLEWGSEFSREEKNKLLSLGILASQVSENIDITPYYHSLTTDSYGVLSDVRTGGLKRDLSSAFLNESDWGNLDVSDVWADDFSNYIYKQRIYYQKSVPLEINATLNEWLTSGTDQLMLEEHALLAGPRWTTLGAFHNLYLASNYGDINPNDFPRIVGENNVLFNHLLPFGLKPHSPGNSPSITKSEELRKYFNYFKGLETRPEPKNHPIQPVLVEVKYSQHPIFDQDQLGLAIYPSVAFWNPYDVPISSKNLYIEIPMSVRFEALNAKHFDYYRKWYMSIVDIDLFKDKNPTVDPDNEKPPRVPEGPSFDDKNGNGKQDPGEPSFPPTNRKPTGGNIPIIVPPELRDFYVFFGSPPFDTPVEWADGAPTYNQFRGEKLGGKINVTFLNSSHSDTPSTYGNRHLLLRIPGLQLDPGEKAHFTVGVKQTIQHTPLPAAGETEFHEVVLTKLVSGVEETPALLLSGQSITPFTDPLAIQDTFSDIYGVHPNSTETFNSSGLKLQSSILEQPKGITIYSESPKNVSYSNRKITGKINKHFYTATPVQNYYYENSDVLGIPNSNNLPGYGFLIQFKLPAKAESVVFEQFNIRALINSNQDGYGDNWDVMHFNSHAAFPTPKLHNHQGEEKFFFAGKERIIERYVNFYSLDLLPLSPTPNYEYVNPDLGEMPRVRSFDSAIGFFHEYDDLSPMEAEKNAIMFEVPKSPLLSLLQFRHANLNNYSHGPSYPFGNSYASPLVPRYQTWGKMKAFDEVPVFGSMNVQENIDNANTWLKDGARYNFFPWENKNISYDDPIRDTYVGKDHQNVTLDHSFYFNYALLDGYFMSGLGIGSEWDEEDRGLFEPGNRYLPYRNPRLIPYIRNGEWVVTGYSDKNEELAATGSDSDYRYQTLAGDLLVNGQFNVNSTSVDAWASLLSAFRGQAIQGASVDQEETPVPRFLEYKSSNSWNSLRKLSDQEVNLLANKIVEQVKLRGPFLSYADFVNRRLQGMKINLFVFPYEEWNNLKEKENRDSSLGLRGALQAAVAESNLNDGGLMNQSTESFIPNLPEARFIGNSFPFSKPPLASEMNLISFEFGTHAISQNLFSYPGQRQRWGKGVSLDMQEPIKLYSQSAGKTLEVKRVYYNYSDTFSYGEAPENLLSVENVATAANKPGWIMQSDLLSPLVPVTSVRSDTFVVRVMGETGKPELNSKAWIELTVQRVPDYIKSELDNPHHRPHEPFEDRNFNGYWDSEINEHWIDLNQDSMEPDINGRSKRKSFDQNGGYPNLPADNPIFADGLESDLPLRKDPDEESVNNNSVTVSRMGVNQRFGRKFKIIKFRWLKAQDV